MNSNETEQIEEIIIKCEIILDRIFYPKGATKIDSGEYGIFLAKLVKHIDGYENLYTIKLKGNVCKLEYGTVYKLICKLSEHNEKYGDTYEIMYITKKIDISSAEKQKEFLSNIINEKLVDNLFDMYDDVITLLDEKNIEKLTKVKGIKKATALRIIEEYEECKDYGSIYTELGKIGLTSNMIKKLVEYYNSPDTVIDIIKNNPYDLVKVNGIGFKSADDIALKVGVGFNDYRRIKGFMIHTLIEQGEMGKSYLKYNDLMNLIYSTLGHVEQEAINQTAESLIKNDEIVVMDNGNIIALKRYYKLEEKIFNELIRIRDAENKLVYNNIDDIIKSVEIEQGFEFTDEQKNTIIMGAEHNILAITGLAGSGKSSTAKGICALHDNYEILAVALSGKASVRITEATGLPASTIHRALAWCMGEFTYNRTNPLTCDVLLIDEATMINGDLFLSLLEAVPNGAKVIMMGDVQQLTPIGNCQVYADILDSNVIPVSKLTKPHRQALESGIIPTSISIANQEQIFKSTFEGNMIIGNLQDMELDIEKNPTNIDEKVIKHFMKHYSQLKDLMEIQIVVAMRMKGILSCYNLNTKIQQLINPNILDSEFIKVHLEGKNEEEKYYKIFVGDKVINTKNNYNCFNSEGVKTPVFNGNIGIVKEIDHGTCVVDFVGLGEIVLSKDASKKLELAYASTIHKCITGDTWLYTNNGLIQLNQLNNNAKIGEFKQIESDIQVYNGTKLEKPKSFYNAGLSECKKIVTKRGYLLNGTLDHRIDVLDLDGYIQTKYMRDVKVDDYVLINKNNNIYGSTLKLPANWLNIGTLDIRCTNYKLPTHMTVEFAKFLGYMVTDGVICKSGLKLGKNHKDVVEDFIHCVNVIFGYDNNNIKHKLPNSALGGMYLTEISKFCSNIDGIQPHSKFVPNCILTAPKEMQIAFLQTVFEYGTVNLKNQKFDHIELAFKDELICEQIRMMLLNMGIITTLFKRVTKAGFNINHIYIYKKDAIIFKELIGFISKFKNDRLLTLNDEVMNNSSKKVIPYIPKIIKNLEKKYNLKLYKLSKAFNKISKKNQITDDLLKLFLNEYKDILKNDADYTYLKDICDNTYIDKIENISTSILNTYCLEMPITHKFIQNGIRAWNCQGSGFNTVITAIDGTSFKLNNAELLYTALTRAKKYCVLVGKNSAIRSCISKREVKTKLTFLKTMLKDSEN